LLLRDNISKLPAVPHPDLPPSLFHKKWIIRTGYTHSLRQIAGLLTALYALSRRPAHIPAHLEPSEGVVGVYINPGILQHNIRAERSEGRRQDLGHCREVGLVLDPVCQSHIEGAVLLPEWGNV
jgi:hypothetical protein